jgi:hypothetical protein
MFAVCFAFLSVSASVQWPECAEPFHIDVPVQYANYLTFGSGSLWLSDPEEGVIWRLSPSTGAVQDSIPNSYSGGIAFDGQYLWKAAYSSPVIRCIRPSDGSTVREIPGVGTQQAGLAWDGTCLWIADRGTQRIYKLNSRTGAQLASFESPGPIPRGLAWWNGYLYNCDNHEDRIYQIDPSTGSVISTIATPMRSGSPRGLATDGSHLWYSDWYGGIDRLVIEVSPDSRVIHSNPILMLVEMKGTMTNTGTSTIENPEMYWAVPEANDEHIVLKQAFTPSPDSYVVDMFGQTIAYFSSLDPVPPGGTIQVVCHAYEMIWRVDYQIDLAEVLPLASIPQGVRDLYLVDGDFLHITHPEIVAAALSAIGTETNPYLMAIKLHDFVAELMTYEYNDIPADALEILQSAFGVCEDYAILYMALGRAVGLPTRQVKGFYYYENEDAANNHVWPEVYIPGYGWTPIDPTRDDSSPLRHRYIGCEPLGVVYFRNGGTDTRYVGQWGRAWLNCGASRTTSTSIWGTVPLATTACDARPGDSFGSIEIDWCNPPAVDLSRVIVRRVEERYPASREDGVLIYDNILPTPDAVAYATDYGLDPSKEYFYAVFAQSGTGLWSRMTLEGASGDRCFPAATETAAVFRIDSLGNVLTDQAFYGAAFTSASADVAEWVHISIPAEPGDVIEFDPTAPGQYRVTQNACSSLVAGVISTTPGVTLGTDLDASEKALLALIGLVPVKVTSEGGPIQPGDLLVTSPTPGYAMRWTGPEPCLCSLVGKALESMTGSQGLILVLLTSH